MGAFLNLSGVSVAPMGLPDTATARYLSGYERPLHSAGGHRQGLGSGCESSVLLARGDQQVGHVTCHM